MLYKLWWVGLVGLLSAVLSLGLPPGGHLNGEPEEGNARQEQEGGGNIDPDGLTGSGTAGSTCQAAEEGERGGNIDPDGLISGGAAPGS